MRKPGLPPTVVQEYAADGVKAIESGSMSKLVALLHDVVINRGTITISDALSAAELQPIGPVIAELAVRSLLADPLSDGQDHVGVLVLMHTTPRARASRCLACRDTYSVQIAASIES